MELIKITKLSKMLLALLKLQIVVFALSIISGSFEYLEYSQMSEEGYAEEYLLVEQISEVVGVVAFVLAIVTGIVFLKWIYRVNKNLNTISDGALKFTPGWSIGWYFIPFANLFKPYQAMKEIFLTVKDDPSAKTSLLVRWWSFWILSTAIGEVSSRAVINAETTREYLDALLIYMFSDGIDILRGLVAIKLVSTILANYRANIDETDVDSASVATKNLSVN